MANHPRRALKANITIYKTAKFHQIQDTINCKIYPKDVKIWGENVHLRVDEVQYVIIPASRVIYYIISIRTANYNLPPKAL